MPEATLTAPPAAATARLDGGGLPPHALLWTVATGAALSRCLHAVAALGVADALDPAGGEVAPLAEQLGVDRDALGRVLRALASQGIFDVELPAVRHTDASLLLRSDHPMSMGAFAHMMGLPMSWDALTLLPETLRTGRAGIFDLDAEGLFPYLRAHPDQREVFDRAMTAKSHADISGVLEAHDFGGHRVVADVGGGRGHLLKAIAERSPDVETVLVELPEVVATLAADGPGRMRLVAADFFVDELPAADAYVLMEILHDWDDDDAVRILSSIRRSAPDDAVVLIVETVLDGGQGPAPVLDVVMLCVTGGRERTPKQYAALFAAAGFELVGVLPTAGAVQVVQARVRRSDS